MKAPSPNQALKDLKALSKPQKPVVTKKKPKSTKKLKVQPEKRYTRMGEDKKRRLMLDAFELYSSGMTYQQVAKRLGVATGTMFNLLSSDTSFEYIKNVKSKALAIQFLDDIAENRKAQSKLRSKATFPQLGMDIGIKWDKVNPPMQMAQQFNIGDKKIQVTMPKFFKARR